MCYTPSTPRRTSPCSLVMDTLPGLREAACFCQHSSLQTRSLLARRALPQQTNVSHFQNARTTFKHISGEKKALTRYGLSQDELHLLLGKVFAVFNQLVDSVSPHVKSWRAAFFRQGHLPPALHHHCVLWAHCSVMLSSLH